MALPQWRLQLFLGPPVWLLSFLRCSRDSKMNLFLLFVPYFLFHLFPVLSQGICNLPRFSYRFPSLGFDTFIQSLVFPLKLLTEFFLCGKVELVFGSEYLRIALRQSIADNRLAFIRAQHNANGQIIFSYGGQSLQIPVANWAFYDRNRSLWWNYL